MYHLFIYIRLPFPESQRQALSAHLALVICKGNYVRQVAIATRSNSGFCACFCYTPSGKKTWGQP